MTCQRIRMENKANLYDRANHFRRNNEYDRAMGSNEQFTKKKQKPSMNCKKAFWQFRRRKNPLTYLSAIRKLIFQRGMGAERVGPLSCANQGRRQENPDSLTAHHIKQCARTPPDRQSLPSPHTARCPSAPAYSI